MKAVDSSAEFESSREGSNQVPVLRDSGRRDGFESVDLKDIKGRHTKQGGDDWLGEMDESSQPIGVPSVSIAPFQCLIHEQAKSIVALQELQHDVSNLLAFRDAVLTAFPHLNSLVLGSSGPSTQPPQTWTRRRHMQNQQKNYSSDGKETATTSSGNPGVSDSGFNSEAKDQSSGSTSAASPRSSRWLDYSQTHPAMVHNIAPHGPELKQQLERLRSRIRREDLSSPHRLPRKSSTPIDEKDELWVLLDAIENKGIQMKRDLDSCSGKSDTSMRNPSRNKDRYRLNSLNHSDDSYERDRTGDHHTVVNGVLEAQPSYDSKRDLIERITDTESRLQAALLDLETTKKDRDYYSYTYSKAEAELNTLRSAKTNIENDLLQTRERLLTAEQQVKDTVQKLNSKSADLNELREKLTKLQSEAAAYKRVDEVSVTVNGSPIFPKKLVRSSAQLNLADLVSSQPSEVQDELKLSSEDVLSVIRERNLVELQRRLLKKMVEFSVLKGRLKDKSKSEPTLLEPGEVIENRKAAAEELLKLKDENDELKFQLEEQKIELEGTKAQLRVSRQLSVKQKRQVSVSTALVQTETQFSRVSTQTSMSLCDLVDFGTQTLELPSTVTHLLSPLSGPILTLEAAKLPSRIPTPIKSRTSSLIRTRGDSSIGSLTSMGSKGDKRLTSLKTENRGSLDGGKEKVSSKRDGSLRFEKVESRPSLDKKSKKRAPSGDRTGAKNPSNDGKITGDFQKRVRNRTASSILELTLDDAENSLIMSSTGRGEAKDFRRYYFLESSKLNVNRNLFRKSASHGDGLNDRCYSPIILSNMSKAPHIY